MKAEGRGAIMTKEWKDIYAGVWLRSSEITVLMLLRDFTLLLMM